MSGFHIEIGPELDLSLNHFELLCGVGGYDMSSIGAYPVYGACYHRLCLIWGHWMSQVFTLKCLERLCCGEVIWWLSFRA